MNRTHLSALLCAVLLSACASTPAPSSADAVPEVAPPPSAPTEHASVFRCGDRTATIAFSGDTMRLLAGDSAWALTQVVSGSGAKYDAVGEPGTSFWNKGHTALVTVKGEAWPECLLVASGAQALRADGPGWQLDLYGPRVTLRDGNGQPLVEAHTPGPVRLENSLTYNATTNDGTLVVTAVEKVCAGVSPRPLSVQVAWRGRVLQGCGGDATRLLRGKPWVVEDIEGSGIIDNSRVTLNFTADGRVSGRASCNGYNGPYSIGSEGITFGNFAATTMACAPSLMQQEDRFLKALVTTRRFELTPDGALVLVHADGSRTKARRE